MPIRGQRYRLNTPTLAIVKQDGQNRPTTIPPDAVVKVMDGPLDGDRLVTSVRSHPEQRSRIACGSRSSPSQGIFLAKLKFRLRIPLTL